VYVKLEAMKLKEAAKKIQDSIAETVTYYDFPREHRIRIRTNKAVIRRPTRVGACQASCRLGHAALRALFPSSVALVTTASRSGLSVTAITGVQSRVLRDHRRGLASLAFA
jgi:hypothetical protein